VLGRGAIEMASTIVVVSKGLGNVRIVHGDIHAIEPAAVMSDRRFDAAHLRLVLYHQVDPVATLRRSAQLVGVDPTLLRPAAK